ncbi:hypothetical protein [Nitratireductor luteus]|uniref:hypothetical protein n=1 Tax=Nitratireductor luteus TaxID=2976980 RepID=UPI0022400FD9|nr:hypothetical protein [Nitratireductor luteus]
MKKLDIPKEIMAAIRAAAKEYWDDDKDMVKEAVDSEIEAYRKLQALDFGAAAAVRQEIMDSAAELADSWEERLSMVEDEVAAFGELRAGQFESVPDALILMLKDEAAQKHEGDYGSQRDHVVNGVKGYLYVQEMRAKIGPVSDLLIKMERIIGGECYNGNIQNYGPGGTWEGEGRAFRYPVKFLDGEDTRKYKMVPADLASEVLVTGWYQFGSNELSIFRALVKIVDMIERDYGVKLAAAKR